MNKTCETVTAANGRRADKEQSEDEAGDVDDRTKQAALGTQKDDNEDESTRKGYNEESDETGNNKHDGAEETGDRNNANGRTNAACEREA